MTPETEFLCPRCDRACEMRYDYDLQVGEGEYTVRWFRCPSCGAEYLRSPGLLIPEEVPMADQSGLGTIREVSLCRATTLADPGEPGGGSIGPLVATALAEEMIDAAILPDVGSGPRARVITNPEDIEGLRQSWATRGRSLPVTAGIAANFDLLIDLEQFAREDGGRHPRLAVFGRPCHVYAGRRANMAALAPGYEIALSVGLFCYGNVTVSGSAAMRFQKLTGLAPSEIRGMTAKDGNVKIVGADRTTVTVPLQDFSSFLHRSCLRCVDFTVPWADLSLGECPQIQGFDTLLVRSPTGVRLYRDALESGRLRAWSPPWIANQEEGLKILSDLTALKRELAAVAR